MKTVLLPVKDFRNAKQRLIPAMDAASRAKLARAMLSDVLRGLAEAKEPNRVLIYTAAQEVVDIVRPFGFDVVIETSVLGHSAAVNLMVEELSATSSRILSLAGDLPKLLSSEVDFVLNAAIGPVTLIPSHDGTGTNGVVFNPPARIAMEYGEGSFRRHLSKITAAGYFPDILNVPGIGFDVDTPDDLQAFLDDPRRDSETWRYLMSLK